MIKRLRSWQPSLLVSFSLVGAFIIALIALAFGLGIQYLLEQNALKQEAESAADQVALILSPNLNPVDLAAPLTPERYQQLDDLVRGSLLHEHIVRIKIWNRDGLLVYADEPGLAGQTFPLSAELQEALEGQTGSEVSSLDKEENASERALYTRLLEIYVPIRLEGSDQVAGAYEIYHDLVVLQPTIGVTRRFVWSSVVLGFLLLYGSLFTLVRNASRELVRRNEDNRRLYEQEQTRRAELSALYDLSRQLADTHDSDTILALVSRKAVETVHVTFARLALLDGDVFEVRAAYPVRVLEKDLNLCIRKPMDEQRVCRGVLEQNSPAVFHLTDPVLSTDEKEMLFCGVANSVCLAPLRAGSRTLGLLVLGEARSTAREPFSADKLRLARSIADQAASALHRAELFVQLEQSYFETVLALANAVDAKDTYTADHAQKLAELALAIGRKLGMSERDLAGLRYGAILHDIGKIGVPDAVLKKPTLLDTGEWKQMRQHPEIGANILAPVPHLAGAAQIVRHHHERYDGKGYPDGLAGEAIPLGARILSVVDSYSAIIDRRVYKEARSHADALAELRSHAGTQFDPRVVEVFLSVVQEAGLT